MKTIEQVLAESEILDLHMRYCRAADRRDFALFRTCFHPDAVLIFSMFRGDVDAFVAMAEASLARFAVTTHFAGNHLIEVDGAAARAEFYALATHRLLADQHGPERDYVTSIRYLDILECREGEWRIAQRHCVLDWARSDPVPDYCDGAKIGATPTGEGDPSYAILGAINSSR